MRSMTQRALHPIARTDLVVSELPGEAMIYNFADHSAHCVTELAHRVLLRCDGKTAPRAIAAALRDEGRRVEQPEIDAAIAQLAKAGLVELPARVNTSRRRMLKQMGLTAGLSVAAPVVWSIVAPSVAEAASIACTVMGIGACNMNNVGECCGMTGNPAGTCDSVTVGMSTTYYCNLLGGTCSGNTCR
jgi:hypothetical protein